MCSKLSATPTISSQLLKYLPVWTQLPLMDPLVFIYWTQVGVSN